MGLEGAWDITSIVLPLSSLDMVTNRELGGCGHGVDWHEYRVF